MEPKNESKEDRRRIFLNRLIRVGFAVGISILITQFDLDYLESYTYDLRMRFRPSPEISGQVATIATLPSTVEELKRVPNTKDHIQFLERLAEAKPKAVIYLINPESLVGSYGELEKFALVSTQIEQFIIARNDLSMRGEENKFRLPPPLNQLNIVPGPHTADTNILAKDGVSRRTLISYQGQSLLHFELVKQLSEEMKTESDIRGNWHFLDTTQTYIDFTPPGTFPRYSFESILKGDTDLSQLKGKIVFVGRDTGTTAKDYVKTPYSRNITEQMTVLELHANMLDSLIRNSSPIRSPSWINLIFTILISILTVYVVLALRPIQGLGILMGSLCLYILISYILLWPFGVWLGLAHPLLAIFICYYFFIPYRLIMENRRSWEYYQKNKLLTQVEELKTNFIGMMSHDLKTPLARIQGMAEVIGSNKDSLNDQQKEAVLFIQNSSQDLTHFIEAILNFGRIESSGVQLHLQSRDINTLISETIKKCDYLARQKQIEIISEQEPLFSIKVDGDLVMQVFTNLIENAIKYSPENSKILISTEETDGKVIIQVADQGAGIPTDEIENIFMKFFRTRDAKSSHVKGSGLGLYLAKYFVELHNGAIFVESALHQGSTFTVELPIDTTSA